MRVTYLKHGYHDYTYSVHDKNDEVVFTSKNWGEIAQYLREWNHSKNDSPGV